MKLEEHLYFSKSNSKKKLKKKKKAWKSVLELFHKSLQPKPEVISNVKTMVLRRCVLRLICSIDNVKFYEHSVNFPFSCYFKYKYTDFHLRKNQFFGA